MSLIKNFMETLSRGRRESMQDKVEILGNVVGFYRSDSSIPQSQLILEIGRIFDSKNVSTCIISTDPQNDFYVGKFIDKIVKDNKNDDGDSEIEVPSLMNRFINSRCELSECLNDCLPSLKLLGFGLTPYSSTFNMDLDTILSTYAEAKSAFDLVLVDMTNNPYLESTIAGLQICDRVYNMIDFSPTAFLTEAKIQAFYEIAGLNNKLMSTVVNNVPYGYTIKESLNSSMVSNILLEIPAVENLSVYNLEKGPILPKLTSKAGVGYSKCVEYLVDEIINGLGGGSSNDNNG